MGGNRIDYRRNVSIASWSPCGRNLAVFLMFFISQELVWGNGNIGELYFSPNEDIETSRGAMGLGIRACLFLEFCEFSRGFLGQRKWEEIVWTTEGMSRELHGRPAAGIWPFSSSLSFLRSLWGRYKESIESVRGRYKGRYRIVYGRYRTGWDRYSIGLGSV